MGIRSSYLGFARETTFGTYVEPTRSFEGEADELRRRNNYIERRGLRAGRQTRRSAEVTVVGKGAGGNLPLTVMQTGFGMLFRAAADTSASALADSASSAYLQQHDAAAEIAPDDIESLTYQIIRGTLDGTEVHSYTGVVIPEWELRQDVDDYLKFTPMLDASAEVTNQSAHTAAYPSAADEYHWGHLAVTIDGTAVEARSGIRFRARRGLDITRYRLAGTTRKAPPRVSDPEYTLEFDIDYEDDTYNDLFISGGIVEDVVLTWTGLEEIESGFDPYLKLTLPAVQLRGDTPKASVEGDEPVQPLRMTVLHDDSNPAFSLDYQTADSDF